MEKNCKIINLQDHKPQIQDSLKEELKKEKHEETTFQIRLFDDKTGRAFYKQLTQEELLNIMKTFDKMEWW